jgi:hypothetical protein
MPDNTNTQRSLLMLWLMLITNRDIYNVAVGQTLSVSSVLNNLTAVQGIDNIKQQLVAASLSPGYAHSFNALRGLYQSFSQQPEFWPPVAGGDGPPDHPTIEDLANTFFQPPVNGPNG